jgi:hypothetical protein
MGLTEKMLLLAVGLLLIILIATGNLNRTDKLKQLKEKYDAALQGEDRELAIEAGRAYYRFLRGSELTIEDEQAILRDISSMPDETTGNSQ